MHVGSVALSRAGKYSEAILSFEHALRIAGEFQTGGRRLLYTIDARLPRPTRRPESLDTNAAIPMLQRAITLSDVSAGQVTSLRNYLFQIYVAEWRFVRT
jgi:hypothetical protein